MDPPARRHGSARSTRSARARRGAPHASCVPVTRVVAGLVAVLVLVLSSTTAAALRPAQDSGTAVRLVEQEPWISMGDDAAFEVAVTGTDDAEIALSVHARIADRAALVTALDGSELGTVLGRRRFELEDLKRRGSDTVTVEIGTQSPDEERDENLVALERSGVYPVRIAVEDTATGASDELVTFLVAVAPDEPQDPYEVSFVVPLKAAPMILPDGTRDDSVLEQVRPGGRLDRIASELAAVPSVAATLAVGPESAASWSDAALDDARVAPGIEALRAAVERSSRQVLAEPYVRLDLPALVASDLATEIATQYRAGADTLNETLDVRVDPRLAVADPIDDPSLSRLRRDLFVDRVVVPEGVLETTANLGARGGVYGVESSEGDLDAALADPFLYALTTLGGSTALQAQRVLAALSLDQSGDVPAAGAVVTFPHDWDPDEGLLRLLLEGMEDNPLLEAVTLDRWFARVDEAVDDADQPMSSPLRTIDTGTASVGPSQLATARYERASLESLLGDDPRVESGAAAILRAPSADLVGADGTVRVRADLDQISQDADAFLSGITTTPKTVTLTGKDATIPLTFTNDTDRNVAVRARFESSKLVFPDGDEQVLELSPGSTTVRIPVEARATGTFPLFVNLSTEDQVFEIGERQRITIRTTLLGGLGGWITLGAAGFLGVWWISHAWRNRRRRVESTS